VPVLDRGALREVGLAHDVCPYYLGSEMARWTDVAIGDYNYYFDGSAMLYALAQANGWRASVLVDEAHNMVSRARSMYSCELDRVSLRAARAAAPPLVKKALSKIARVWGEIDEAAPLPYQVLDAPGEKLLNALPTPPAPSTTSSPRTRAARSRPCSVSTSTPCSLRAWPNPSASIRCAT
jgi:DNA excision repair protein ERCC-2